MLAEILERENVVSERLCTVVLLEKGKNGKIGKLKNREIGQYRNRRFKNLKIEK